MAESTEKRSRYCTGRELRWSARQRLMLPGVLHPPQKEGKAAAAMGEADAQRFRQAIESAAQHESRNRKLGLGRHGDRPRHHVLRHALRSHHVPGMHQHGRTFVGAVMQEGHDAGIVEIFRTDVIADLHADMPGLHASREFGTGSIDVLQRHLAKGFEPPMSAAAHLQCGIVKDSRNF